jgi:hypothetical protein
MSNALTKHSTAEAVDGDSLTAQLAREHMIAPDDIHVTSAAQAKHLAEFKKGCDDWLK